MDTANNSYPAFQFPASELSAFAVTIDFFIISLKSGDIIHFMPDNIQTFYDWLTVHGVRDIQNDKIKTEKPATVTKPVMEWTKLFKRKRQNGKS